MIKYQKFNVLEEFGTNSYILWDEKSLEAIIIDPSSGDSAFEKFISQKNLKLKYLINTHGHLDHIGGNSYIKTKFNVPIVIHKNDAEMLINSKLNLSEVVGMPILSPKADILITEKDNNLFLGENKISVIHTPGHTKGSICLLIDNILVSGDTLFYESIGRTDLPGGSFDEIVASIQKKLFTLSDEILVLPGHGRETTIEDEKVGNPFVGILSKFSGK